LIPGSDKAPTASISHRPWDAVPGLWKFLCALAILFGHNLVTLMAWHPAASVWKDLFHPLQFFSPLHFFFFSGYFAASGLLDVSRPILPFMKSRGLRVYVLVVAALAWGLAMRLATLRASGGAQSLGTIWPLGCWDAPLDWRDAFMHLSPIGFADHTRFNYATWYLYQELRIVLLFPLFRWILHRESSLERWGWTGCLMVTAALLEYKFWSYFPLFRSSPFQTLAYGCYFLSGCLVWMEIRRPAFASAPKCLAFLALFAGLAISYLEAFGIQPRVGNPPVLMVQTLIGQTLLFLGLKRLWGGVHAAAWLRKACEWSVGIYIVHPPLHVVATWIAVSMGSAWPLLVEIALAIVGGALFHRFVERPSQRWATTLRTQAS
jgi:peptidoglycan/LPS O-acetylase OafA/YrhL